MTETKPDKEGMSQSDKKSYWQKLKERAFDSNASYWLMGGVIFLFLVLMIVGTLKIMNQGTTSCQLYKAIGFGMIMIWVCIFICYFIWAVYFYNFNYGFSRKDWKKIDQAKENRSKGNFYSQEDIDEEPKYNPYKDETFGLPGGTVRGMIAFTLLFGSISMLIVSFGMENEVESDSFFIDQFDFFKKAFLMMIAFYFGTHSLKYLKPAEPKQLGHNNSYTETETAAPKSKQASQPFVVIQPDSNKEPDDTEKMPPITAIDPMAPKG